MDTTKRKHVTVAGLRDMIQKGSRPVLVCNQAIEQLGLDIPFELGMFARVTQVVFKDDGWQIWYDMTEFETINDGMMSHDWYLPGMDPDLRKTGTSKEAGRYKAKDYVWLTDDFLLEIVEELAPTTYTQTDLEEAFNAGFQAGQDETEEDFTSWLMNRDIDRL